MASLLRRLFGRRHTTLSSSASNSNSCSGASGRDDAGQRGNIESEGRSRKIKGMTLAALPDELLLHAADSFCSDADAASLARCSRPMLRALGNYRVKRLLHSDDAIRMHAAAARRAATASSDEGSDESEGASFAFGLPIHARNFSGVPRSPSYQIASLSSLRPLADCQSLRSFDIRLPDEQQLASDMSLILPPDLHTLSIQGGDDPWAVLRVHEAVEELRLPPSLTRLTLPLLAPKGCASSDVRKSALSPVAILPPSLRHLMTDWCSHRGVAPLPPGLHSLRLESMVDRSSSAPDSFVWPLLPESLRELSFGRRFCSPIAGLRLPSSLTLLDLSECGFNAPIEPLILPPNLCSLRFNSTFNQPIEQLRLPPSLTELRFDKCGEFNRSIEQLHLPEALSSLLLPNKFNQPCAALRLPPGLTHLRFGRSFNNSLPLLPDSIRTLQLDSRQFDTAVPLQLPPLVESLKLSGVFPQLRDRLLFAPNSALTHLSLLGYSLDVESVRGMAWPSTLRVLHFSCRRWQADSLARMEWPAALQELRLGDGGEKALDNWTPLPSLTHLLLNSPPTHCSRVRWPPRLQCISFHWFGVQEVRGPFHWPPTLTAMRFLSTYSSGRPGPLPDGFLPPSLIELQMTECWDGAAALRKLPHGLRHLEVAVRSQGASFNPPISQLLRILPPGLQSLKLHQYSHEGYLDPTDGLSLSASRLQSILFDAPQLPPSLTRLHVMRRRALSTEEWQRMLNERPDCCVSSSQEDEQMAEYRSRQQQSAELTQLALDADPSPDGSMPSSGQPVAADAVTLASASSSSIQF